MLSNLKSISAFFIVITLIKDHVFKSDHLGENLLFNLLRGELSWLFEVAQSATLARAMAAHGVDDFENVISRSLRCFLGLGRGAKVLRRAMQVSLAHLVGWVFLLLKVLIVWETGTIRSLSYLLHIFFILSLSFFNVRCCVVLIRLISVPIVRHQENRFDSFRSPASVVRAPHREQVHVRARQWEGLVLRIGHTSKPHEIDGLLGRGCRVSQAFPIGSAWEDTSLLHRCLFSGSASQSLHWR